MLFKQVIGQEPVKDHLRQSVQTGRIPHAQLFFGPEGSGTLPLAIAYAQYVACTSRSEEDSCGECSSCKKFLHVSHPDLHFVFPVNTSKEVKKDPTSDDYLPLWRETLLQNPYFLSAQWYNLMEIENKQGLISRNDSEGIIRKLSLKSFESDYKFLILWLPEKMHSTAANMLLKLLEEPPEKTIFLMVSEVPEQVLVTISSRTQPVKLSKIDHEVLANYLVDKHQLLPPEASKVARLAGGSLIAALEILETSEETAFQFEQFGIFMRLSYKGAIPEINSWVDEMAGIGRERLKGFFIYALRLLRENFIKNLQNDNLLYLSNEEEVFSEKFHPFVNGRNIIDICHEFTSASADIERNANAKIVLFDMALKMIRHIRK